MGELLLTKMVRDKLELQIVALSWFCHKTCITTVLFACLELWVYLLTLQLSEYHLQTQQSAQSDAI